MNKKIRIIGTAALIALWICIAVFAWLSPAKEQSLWERRALQQMPQISLETLQNGNFANQFEDYTLDQFPMRDSFRSLKSLFSYKV